jgi:hypothetical protein
VGGVSGIPFFSVIRFMINARDIMLSRCSDPTFYLSVLMRSE